MGRSKKQQSDLERLEAELKELKSFNKSLKRQVKISNRPQVVEVDDSELEQQFTKKVDVCPKCQKGEIKVTDLGIKSLEACSNGCGYRKTIKK